MTRILPRADRYQGLVEITKGNRTFQMVGDPDVTLPLLEAHVAATTGNYAVVGETK